MPGDALGDEPAVRWEMALTLEKSRVTHSGFDRARPDFDDYNGGWSTVLSSLRRHAEAVNAAEPPVRHRDQYLATSCRSHPAEAFYAAPGFLTFRAATPTQIERAHSRMGDCTAGPSRVQSIARRARCCDSAVMLEAEDPGGGVGRRRLTSSTVGFVIDVIEWRLPPER